MAQYDQGGGCACGIRKECDCSAGDYYPAAVMSAGPGIRKCKKEWSSKTTTNSIAEDGSSDLSGSEFSIMVIPKEYHTLRLEIKQADGTFMDVRISKQRLKQMIKAIS